MKMNVDNPKMTAYALGELSGKEEERVATEVANLPEAQAHVAELCDLAQMLRSEYETERAAGGLVRSRNLIDICGDRWFWTVARPLAIAATLAVAALVAAII